MKVEREKNSPTFDGHNDVLLSLALAEPDEERSFLDLSKFGHIDLPRAQEGGFGGGMFAIFVPPGPPPSLCKTPVFIKTDKGVKIAPFLAIDQQYASTFTDDRINELEQIAIESNGELEIVRTVTQLRNCLNTGKIAAVLHFEGAEAIHPDLSNLQSYYEKGLRSLGLVWSRKNSFGEGVPFEFPRTPDTGSGLRAEGKLLVEACDALGIVIDLAHLNEKGFWDVSRLTSNPLVVSHSAVHKLCRTTRNLTDKQIDAVGESDGIIGINFHVGDLSEGMWKDPSVPMERIVDHITYIVERIGMNHVGFGSDFDGAMVSEELKDVTGLPKLITLLCDKGFSDEDLRKISSENWLRVISKIWKS